MEDLDDRTIFFGNLGYKTTSDDLEKIFSEFGKILSIKIPTRSDGRPKGVAFIEFTCRADAEKAISRYDKQKILGRVCFLKLASAPLTPPSERKHLRQHDRPRYNDGYRDDYRDSGMKGYPPMNDDYYRYNCPPPPPPNYQMPMYSNYQPPPYQGYGMPMPPPNPYIPQPPQQVPPPPPQQQTQQQTAQGATQQQQQTTGAPPPPPPYNPYPPYAPPVGQANNQAYPCYQPPYQY